MCYLAPMILTERHRKKLRGLAHGLRPVVTVADKGLSDTVLAEIDAALTHHELIKVKIRTGDRDERDRLIDDLLTRMRCELILRIGNVATLFRRNPQKPKVELGSK